MGCDIHLFSEAKRHGKWEPAVPFVLSDWWYDAIIDEDYEYDTPEYRAQEEKYKNMSQEEVLKKYGDDPRVDWEYPFGRAFGDRNYYLFAVLADVRNYGDAFVPIAEPRGLPEDVSIKIKRISDYWGGDGHSHSYFTLKELLEYDWEQGAGQRGLVVENVYKRMLSTNSKSPDSWAERICGPDVEQISNREMEDLINGKMLRESGKHYITECRWGETYREAVGADYLEELCTELLQYGKPEDVRIVFWFDN